MPLTKESLSSKIKAEIEASYGPADDPSILQKFADAIAKAVVDEIQQNALANTSTGVIS